MSPTQHNRWRVNAEIEYLDKGVSWSLLHPGIKEEFPSVGSDERNKSIYVCVRVFFRSFSAPFTSNTKNTFT